MPYQQIDKEHYPQLYKNKRQRVVLSAIGTGREQGAHLRDLTEQRGSEKEASARSLKIFDALAWWFAIALTGISSPKRWTS